MCFCVHVCICSPPRWEFNLSLAPVGSRKGGLSQILINSTPVFIMERESGRERDALSGDMLESAAHVGRSRRELGVVLIAFL